MEYNSTHASQSSAQDRPTIGRVNEGREREKKECVWTFKLEVDAIVGMGMEAKLYRSMTSYDNK